MRKDGTKVGSNGENAPAEEIASEKEKPLETENAFNAVTETVFFDLVDFATYFG